MVRIAVAGFTLRLGRFNQEVSAKPGPMYILLSVTAHTLHTSSRHDAWNSAFFGTVSHKSHASSLMAGDAIFGRGIGFEFMAFSAWE